MSRSFPTSFEMSLAGVVWVERAMVSVRDNHVTRRRNSEANYRQEKTF